MSPEEIQNKVKNKTTMSVQSGQLEMLARYYDKGLISGEEMAEALMFLVREEENLWEEDIPNTQNDFLGMWYKSALKQNHKSFWAYMRYGNSGNSNNNSETDEEDNNREYFNKDTGEVFTQKQFDAIMHKAYMNGLATGMANSNMAKELNT